jgi:hypothetical protein
VIAIGSPLKKTILLITLTTLTIGLGASLQWEEPSQDAHINDQFTLNVTEEDAHLSEDVEFFYDEGDGWEDLSTGDNNSGYYTASLDGEGLGNIENLELRANTTSDVSTDQIDRTVTLDNEEPDVEPPASQFAQEDPELTFDVSDDYSEITDVEAEADSGDGDVSVDEVDDDCDDSSDCEATVEVDTEDLEGEDEFTVTVTATDEAGNEGDNGEEEFTLDTSYDGDESADVEWADEDSTNILDGSANEDQDVDITLDEGDSVSDTSVTCLIDDEEVGSDTEDMTDGDPHTFSCDLSHEDYAGSSFELTVNAEDAAGNDPTLVEDKEMYWDTSAPSVDSLESPSDVSTFNEAFNLSVSVTDDASGIETLEYYFSSDTEVGSGTSISVESGSTSVEKEFKVDPGLDRGNHTVYVRAVDVTGKEDVAELDFEYYPDRNPEVSLTSSDSVNVTSGETSTLDLTIENGAPFFMDSVVVESDSKLWNGSVTAEDLESGDKVEKTISIDASGVDHGIYEMVLTSSNYDASVSVEVRVRAAEDQKSGIEQRVQEWVNKSESFKQNVSEIGTLDVEDGNVTRFTELVDNASKAVTNGEYYKASEYLKNVDSRFSEASKVYSEKLEQHKENKQQQMLFIAIAVIVLLALGGVAGYFVYGDEELPEFIPKEVELPDEVPKIGLVAKIKELIGEAEDEIEEETGYSFEGFD